MRRPFDHQRECPEDVGGRRFWPLVGSGRGISLVLDDRMPRGKIALVAPRRRPR